MQRSEEITRHGTWDVLDLVPDAIVVLDVRSTVLHANAEARRLLGLDQNELLGRTALDFVHSGDQERALQAVTTISAEHGTTDAAEVRVLRPDGSCVWCEIRARVAPQPDERTLVVASIRDVETSAIRTQLVHQATHDHLTGAANRHLLVDRLEHALEVRARTGQPAVVAFVDVDGLKAINDEHGHLTGDHVLREIAERLRSETRATDTVARYGGDEFVIVFEAADPAEASSCLRRIHDVMTSPVVDGDIELSVSISTGVAVATDDSTPRQLIADADAAMYASRFGFNGP